MGAIRRCNICCRYACIHEIDVCECVSGFVCCRCTNCQYCKALGAEAQGHAGRGIRVPPPCIMYITPVAPKLILSILLHVLLQQYPLIAPNISPHQYLITISQVEPHDQHEEKEELVATDNEEKEAVAQGQLVELSTMSRMANATYDASLRMAHSTYENGVYVVSELLE